MRPGLIGVPFILLGIPFVYSSPVPPLHVLSPLLSVVMWVPVVMCPFSALPLWVGIQAQTAGRAEASRKASEAAEAGERLPGLPPASATRAEAPGEEATVPLQGGHESQREAGLGQRGKGRGGAASTGQVLRWEAVHWEHGIPLVLYSLKT